MKKLSTLEKCHGHIVLPLLLLTLGCWLAPRAAAQLQVRSFDGRILSAHFDQPVQSQSATTTSNYTVYAKSTTGSPITVTNAILLGDEQTVALYLNSSAGEFFAVGVSNILDFNGSNIVADATGYLNYVFSSSIATAGDPSPTGEAISIFRDVFQVTASGSDIGGTNDHCQFVCDRFNGNFEMVANFTRLDFSDRDAKVCLMARESLSPGSRSIEIGFTPLVPGFGTNRVFMLARTNFSSNAVTFGFPPSQVNSLGWLRMTRTNNAFAVYYTTNDATSWTQCGAVTNNSFSADMYLGVALTSHTNGLTTTAGVSGFGLRGVRSGTGVVPTLSVAIYSNNIVAKWQRTLRDFAVQVTDNLNTGTAGSVGSSSNNPTGWGYVMLPIFDTSITGTNAAMPTSGRYMTIPMDLLGGSQMFVRLTQVERVIPDPINVSAGIVLSQAAGNIFTTNSGGLLGTYGVYTGTALATTNGTYVICAAGSSYQFTTENSSSSVHTVLQLRKAGSLTVPAGNINAGSSTNSYKAQVTFPVSASITNYTFVVAATNSASYRSSDLNPIIMDIRIK